MLEQFWAKAWHKMLNRFKDNIAISHKISSPSSPIKFIEIVKDCISVYQDQDLYQRYLTETKKSTEITNSDIVKCKGYGNDLENFYKVGGLKRHLIWHVNDKIQSLPHNHFIATDKSNIKKESIKCLLEGYMHFGAIVNATFLTQKDIETITSEYEKQIIAMKQFAKELGRESAKSFIFLVLFNFILDFTARYLMPIMLYHSPEISKYKDTLLKIGWVIQPLFGIVNQLLNYDFLLSRLLISISNMIAQYAGIEWLPNEFFQFINLANLLLTSELDGNVAHEVGFNVAAVLGCASAKSLGFLLSNCLIHQLPKLKEEPLVDNTSIKTMVVNKKEDDSGTKNLRQRK